MSDFYKSVLTKVSNLDKLIIHHKMLADALKGIDGCILRTQKYRESVNCVVIAEGGMGKSTLCREILSRMKPYVINCGDYEKQVVPAFHAELPSPATIKNVAKSLLRQLKDPNPSVGDTVEMTKRLCDLLASCETKIILLDEFHHLLKINNRCAKLNMVVCDWIKDLVNSTGVTFCLLGSPEFDPVLRSDSQLARRFLFCYPLRPLTYNDSEDGPLELFLAQVEAYCRLSLKISLPKLDGKLIVRQIDAATSGSPFYIMALVKETLLLGLSKGGNSITVDDFAMAWDSGVTFNSSRIKQNPFRMTMNVLANKLGATL